MSKKRKKNKGKYFSDYNDKKKSKKSKKSGKSDYYSDPAVKRMKPNLSKKEVKENRAIAKAPYEIPKHLLKSRRKCNHAGEKMTVAEFCKTCNAAITPTIKAMIETFGEQHCMICKSCYDVVVDESVLDPDKIGPAAMTLYAATNYVISHKRLDDEEINAFAKNRDDLVNFAEIASMMRKIREEYAQSGNADVGEMSLKELSRQ